MAEPMACSCCGQQFYTEPTGASLCDKCAKELKGSEENNIYVLDKGYIKLLDHMGDDHSVVRAARVSYNKHEEDGRLELIDTLQAKRHTSPFRHAFLSFEIKAPLFVARQWWKHVVGSDHTMGGWNELSRRYFKGEREYYIPSELSLGSQLELQTHYRICEHQYETLVQQGISPQLARLALPAYALYTTWIWSTSLNAVNHFLELRMDKNAQHEIQVYANAVYLLTKDHFPRGVYRGQNDS